MLDRDVLLFQILFRSERQVAELTSVGLLTSMRFEVNIEIMLTVETFLAMLTHKFSFCIVQVDGSVQLKVVLRVEKLPTRVTLKRLDVCVRDVLMLLQSSQGGVFFAALVTPVRTESETCKRRGNN